MTSFNIWYRYQLASLGKRLKQEIYFEYLTNIFSTIHVATVLYDIFLSQQWAIILIRPRRRWSWERIFVRSWRVSKDFISNEIFCWNAESSLVNTLKTPTSLRGNRNIISFVCKWSWRDDDLDYAAVWTSVALIPKKLDLCCCGNFFEKTFHSDILIIDIMFFTGSLYECTLWSLYSILALFIRKLHLKFAQWGVRGYLARPWLHHGQNSRRAQTWCIRWWWWCQRCKVWIQIANPACRWENSILPNLSIPRVPTTPVSIPEEQIRIGTEGGPV